MERVVVRVCWMVGCECPSRPAESSPTRSVYLGGVRVGLGGRGGGKGLWRRGCVGRGGYLWPSRSQT